MRRIATILLYLVIPSVSTAGNWHYQDNLKCENCHLTHSSELGLELPGGASPMLLLKGSVNELCLSCHDGSVLSAPDVLAPVTMYQSAPMSESSAGALHALGALSGKGHSLGVPVTTPLNSASLLMTLDCSSCHAVHGNENFRNLEHDPALVGDSVVLREGVDIFTEFLPSVPPSQSASVSAYNASNVGYKQGLKDWCITCHSQLEVNVGASTPAHFSAHPSDVALEEFIGDVHTDASHWLLGAGAGFSENGVNSSGIARTPFQAPQATNFLESQEIAGSNQVFCGSCHKAHSAPNTGNILWPYLDGGETYIAGCQQCHNK